MANADPPTLALVVGIDWADEHHDVSLRLAGSSAVEHARIPHTPEALADWVRALRGRCPDGLLGIALETSRGPLIHALLEYDFVRLYPVNPRSLRRFREAFDPSGAKDDVPDADLLRELLEKHRDRLRVWKSHDPKTRALARLNEHRRKLVDLRTKLTQQLRAALKEYFPQALSWAGEDLASPLACDFLLHWPTLEKLQRARPVTVRRFYYARNCRRGELIEKRLGEIRDATPLTTDSALTAPTALYVQALARQIKLLGASIRTLEEESETLFATHENADLFSGFPGAGAALAPRLAAFFGTDRDRFEDAEEAQTLSGIAPVTKRSGKSCIVHWRWAASTFTRQTFHEFAHHSTHHSEWARVFYELKREQGKDHDTAVRALAFKWIRILWRCWKDRTAYDEDRYIQALAKRGSPVAARLSARATAA